MKSGHVMIMPTSYLSFGGSIVGVDGELPTALGTTVLRAEIPEVMMNFRMAGFDLFAGYASKHSWGTKNTSTQTTEKFDRTGEGIYGSLGYTSNVGFGMTFEYKDYRFDPVNIAETNSNGRRPTRALPMQNPPIAYKEHSFYFLSRRPHVIDFNDEIGMQLDAYYALSPKITLNLNGSMSSRQKSYYLKNGEYIAVERDNLLLPSTNTAFAPFYELYAEVEWYFEGQSYLRAALNKRYDVQSYETIGKPLHLVSSVTLPMRIEYMLNDEYSLALGLEEQWFHDSVVKQNEDYYNQYVSLTYTRAALWSANLRMEFTTDETDQSGKTFWITGRIHLSARRRAYRQHQLWHRTRRACVLQRHLPERPAVRGRAPVVDVADVTHSFLS